VTPEGERLDRFLSGAIDELKTKGTMPEVGGKKLAGDFGSMLSDVRKMIDEAKLGLAGAVTELTTEIKTSKLVEKALREETAAVRKAFGEMLGNAPPSDDDAEITPVKPEG